MREADMLAMNGKFSRHPSFRFGWGSMPIFFISFTNRLRLPPSIRKRFYINFAWFFTRAEAPVKCSKHKQKNIRILSYIIDNKTSLNAACGPADFRHIIHGTLSTNKAKYAT
jgi:hypothetical protein